MQIPSAALPSTRGGLNPKPASPVAPPRSARIDDVDGPASAASKCQCVAAGAPQEEGPSNERFYQNRGRYRQERFSRPCAGERGRSDRDAQAESGGDAQVLFIDRTVSGWDGGLRLGPLLGAGVARF